MPLARVTFRRCPHDWQKCAATIGAQGCSMIHILVFVRSSLQVSGLSENQISHPTQHCPYSSSKYRRENIAHVTNPQRQILRTIHTWWLSEGGQTIGRRSSYDAENTLSSAVRRLRNDNSLLTEVRRSAIDASKAATTATTRHQNVFQMVWGHGHSVLDIGPLIYSDASAL